MFKGNKKSLIKKKLITNKKIFLYLKTGLDDDGFRNFQKIISFFVQAGIYENTEKFLNKVLNICINNNFSELCFNYFKLNFIKRYNA